MTAPSPPLLRPCPTCGTPASVARDNPDRPFCSARCRTRDLMSWLDEDYRIPGPPVDPEAIAPTTSRDED
ncbi:MAG: DNA gyrase inhibitor YacG [Alphaproteobacteria bacterium]|nr:DNA gyrase inhibitor YacG [Alphaproteobacteria bacterium]